MKEGDRGVKRGRGKETTKCETLEGGADLNNAGVLRGWIWSEESGGEVVKG